MKEVTRIEYGVFSYRLHDGTAKKMKELKEKSNLTYNKLFNSLIESYDRSQPSTKT